jgi:hypothetical protein
MRRVAYYLHSPDIKQGFSFVQAMKFSITRGRLIRPVNRRDYCNIEVT